MGRLVDIQTVLEPLQKLEKNLEIAELFKTMNQPDLARADRNAL